MQRSGLTILAASVFLAAVAFGFLLSGGTRVAEAHTVVAFDPNPLTILCGQTRDVTLTLTKDVTQTEIDNGFIDVRLVDEDDGSGDDDDAIDDLLDTASIAVPGSPTANDDVTVTHVFPLECDGCTLVGLLGSSFESSAELRIEFPPSTTNFGDGIASCITNGPGGIAEVLASGSDSPASPAAGSGSSVLTYAALAGAVAAGAVAIAAGGWYARRRFR